MRKKLFGLILLLLAIVIPVSSSLALEDCSDKTDQEAADCWYNREKELRQLISQNQGQQKTLGDTINYLNNQIALTQSQIYQKESELSVLEQDIATLGVKIERLDINLTDVSRILVSRIGAAYKRTYYKPLYLFLSSGGFNDFFERNKYLQVAQQNDRKLLLELQNSKDQHEEQKTLKEIKQDEVEEKRLELAAKKSTLANQQQEKGRLLEVTKNDEKKYQDLLTQARNQRAAFSRFVSRFGGASILGNQTKCDGWGCYYNQRDGQWGNQFIGLSSESVANVGCLITSMAMISSHYGKSLTPGQIAGNTDPFVPNTAYMWLRPWTVNGVTMNRVRLGSALSLIDDELNAGRPVIVGIYGGPDHFLVIKGKDGDDYIMHDPFPAGGNDIKFTSKYPLSAITQVDRVTVQ